MNAMKLVRAISGLILVLLATSSPAAAQNITFSITPSSFTYPSANPDMSPVVTSPPLTIAYKLSGWPGLPWAITIQADTNLNSPTSSIPAGNITWTATPSPFVNGTLSTTAQTLAHGTGNITSTRYGYLTFSLKNLWSYPAGTYSHTVSVIFSAQ